MSVLEFVAVGRETKASLCFVVKGGGNKYYIARFIRVLQIFFENTIENRIKVCIESSEFASLCENILKMDE